jgi:hypothetical protein
MMGGKNWMVLCMLLLASTWNVLRAQLEFPEDKVKWKFTVEQNGDEAIITGTITMVEHWHIYAANLPEGSFAIPTKIDLKKSDDFKAIGGVIEPKPIFVHDDLADEDLYYHSHTVKLKRKIKVLTDKDFTLTGTFSFQTCDDNHCLPPHKAEFTVKIKGVSQDEASADNIEETFVSNKDNIATDKDGLQYVKVNNTWHAVPEGNSAAFYKKYLELGGKDE